MANINGSRIILTQDEDYKVNSIMCNAKLASKQLIDIIISCVNAVDNMDDAEYNGETGKQLQKLIDDLSAAQGDLCEAAKILQKVYARYGGAQ